MSLLIATALIFSGILVGFINTLAGGGTIISLSLFMLLGLPANVANGTYRIAALCQNAVTLETFRHQKMLDTRKGIWLCIPTIIGSVIGARVAVNLDEKAIEKAFAVAMIFMLFFLFYKPEKWLKGQQKLIEKKVSVWQMLLFFFIGIYGGFVHVGVGYFILAGVVLGAGYDLVKANALKTLIVFAYVPFTLAIFIWEGQVNYEFGIIHAIGNVIGGYLATRFAVSWGAQFVRWAIVVIILVSSVQLLGLYDFKQMFEAIL